MTSNIVTPNIVNLGAGALLVVGKVTFLLPGILFLTEIAQAESQCPEYIISDGSINKHTTYGIPLSSIVSTEIIGTRFSLQIGYLNPWPLKLRQAEDVRTSRSLSIAFWTPSKRYPERNMFKIPSYHPCESGRLPPTDNQYIVRAIIQLPFKMEPYNYITPMKKYRNRINYDDGGEDDFVFHEENGLVRFEHRNEEMPYTSYRHVLGSDVEALIDCTPASRTAVNPQCFGYIFFSSDNFGFYYRISRKNFSGWYESALAVRSLALEWREKEQINVSTTSDFSNLATGERNEPVNCLDRGASKENSRNDSGKYQEFWPSLRLHI